MHIRDIDTVLLEAVRASGLFDESWYVSAYPDVGKLGIDPIVHYLWLGRLLGRDPSPNFSGKAYLAANPEVARSGLDPFVHYLQTVPHKAGSALGAARHDTTLAKAVSQKRRHFDSVADPAARIISFYLPQFHAFEQNDGWWGKGFTEWSNVKPAQPQFLGHYQPHKPHDDLGYYDLLDGETYGKQIDIARSHGVFGFCFYYYWFDGSRLMEKAIDAYLADRSLDFPFCLCWANENWTRRWDGLDSEILIAQNHSAEDDLGCIADLARYIRDKRYIRINGRPVVLVYRPALLPDAAATAHRWRKWCRDNGIGEIYLCYTQSFESVDPGEYGFDAAIEFPPNSMFPSEITPSFRPYSKDFSGRIYDWTSLVDRSYAYDVPDYKLFRSLCPGWDNTARRKGAGSILVGNNPDLYEQWLKNAVRETALRFSDPAERIVFVNAWNEWAEGAHLEPDLQNGYAYLEATRNAVRSRVGNPKTAVVVHAFYADVFAEILEYLNFLPDWVELFVTTTEQNYPLIESQLKNQNKRYALISTENKGRDVLPFLKVLDDIVAQKFQYLAKLHTKRSLHRSDGNQWRKELYESVLGVDNFCKSIMALEDDSNLGLLGPRGHLVSMDTYLGSNRDRIVRFAQMLSIDEARLLDHAFFAGTMFIARVSALAPMLQLGVKDTDFEPEAGQIDGTLAHVLERVVGLAVSSRSFRIAYSDDPRGDVKINTTYGFA